MKKFLLSILIISLWLTACGGPASSSGMGFEMGPGGGMNSRHHAAVPDEYASMQSPAATALDVQAGGALYASMCASCHGDGGLGDGPAASALDPAPAPVAHTSTMLSDGYLYWRIVDGGATFGSAMPSWKGSVSEADTWNLIAYMRALGSGEVAPGLNVGGGTYDENAFHQEILMQAVEQGLISTDESETFLLVHDALNEYRTEHAAELPQGSADENQEYLLGELIKAGTITQVQADDFARIHQLLLDAGLME